MRSLDDKVDLFVGDDNAFFAAPASEHSLAQLYAAHPDATIVAGATDVGLWITKSSRRWRRSFMSAASPSCRRSWKTPDGYAFGAGVSLARAEPVLGAIDPDIAEVLRRFGSVQVRAAAPSAATSPTVRRSAIWHRC